MTRSSPRNACASSATRRPDTGDNAFVFGVLHAREERALIETDKQFVLEWSKASKKKRRRWLSGS